MKAFLTQLMAFVLNNQKILTWYIMLISGKKYKKANYKFMNKISKNWLIENLNVDN